jgi:hypothetical protein
MKIGNKFREPVRVVMHLNSGLTKVAVERAVSSGMAKSEIYWDIPTDLIPLHLRAVGKRFVVVTSSGLPEPGDPADALRAAMQHITIEEIS